MYKDADAAVADLKSGSTILSAGFGLCGTAGANSPSPSTYLQSPIIELEQSKNPN